jgi:ABC-type sugar transport system permease subunit
MSTTVYKEAFVFGNLGYGAALAVVLTGLVALATSIQVLASRRKEVN